MSALRPGQAKPKALELFPSYFYRVGLRIIYPKGVKTVISLPFTLLYFFTCSFFTPFLTLTFIMFFLLLFLFPLALS